MAQFTKYDHLYTQEQSKVIAEFLTASKHLSDFEGEISHYDRLEAEEIGSLPQQLAIGHTILLSTGNVIHLYIYIYVYVAFLKVKLLKFSHVNVCTITTCPH